MSRLLQWDDVHVRVSRVWEVHTGKIDFVVIARIFCLNDLSFPSLVQEYANFVLLNEYGHILILSPSFAKENGVPFATADFEKLIESISAIQASFVFFVLKSKDVSE